MFRKRTLHAIVKLIASLPWLIVVGAQLKGGYLALAKLKPSFFENHKNVYTWTFGHIIILPRVREHEGNISKGRANEFVRAFETHSKDVQ